MRLTSTMLTLLALGTISARAQTANPATASTDPERQVIAAQLNAPPPEKPAGITGDEAAAVAKHYMALRATPPTAQSDSNASSSSSGSGAGGSQ